MIHRVTLADSCEAHGMCYEVANLGLVRGGDKGLEQGMGYFGVHIRLQCPPQRRRMRIQDTESLVLGES